MSEPKTALVPDQEQRAAIESEQPAIAVLAGPGSGKTLVLALRARELLARSGATHALLLTFTNKAAAEMKARVLGAAGVTSDRVTANTFHTFSMRLLRDHGTLVDVPQEFTILDDDQKNELCARLYAERGIVDQSARLSYLRVRRMAMREPLVREFEMAFAEAKRELNCMDFDDLVVMAAQLFEEHPEVAAAYATRYPHILVDEFQDTNAAQFAIVKALVATTSTVSVFADDDQAIFQFAGADSGNVRRFVADLGATEYPLTVNYRCREAIVARANRLIAADAKASGRRMRAHFGGGQVLLAEYADRASEARGVAAEIADLVARKVIRPSQVAVLGRSAPRLGPVLDELRALSVPTSNWLAGSYASGERRALRVALSIVRGRLTDFQARQLFQFFNVEDSNERDPVALLEEHHDRPGWAALAEVRRAAWAGRAVSEVVSAAKAAAIEIDDGLSEGFQELTDAVEAFQRLDPDFSLEDLDAELALRSSGPPTVGGGVKVASFHRTKGLQWPRVYLLGLEQGSLPDFRSETGEALRDERRTCFVGVTRAETHLTLTFVRVDKGYAKHPSQFLHEMALV